MENFRIYFDRRRRWVCVYLHDVAPQTFERRGGGRWAYFEPAAERGRYGVLGELHFVSSRVRPDTVAHELIHVLADWMREKGMTFSERSEERIAVMYDELTRNFWREYGKAHELR